MTTKKHTTDTDNPVNVSVAFSAGINDNVLNQPIENPFKEATTDITSNVPQKVQHSSASENLSAILPVFVNMHCNLIDSISINENSIEEGAPDTCENLTAALIEILSEACNSVG